MGFRHALLSLCFLAALARADHCYRGNSLKDNDRVNLSNCDKPPCILKRKTTTAVELKFNPKEDVKSVTNAVFAEILGVPFPFIGVDGMNVCDKIFDASSGAKAPCPLKAGHEYVYKDEFKVLEIYPKIKVQVHWALKDEKDENILCFQVPARITA